MESSSSVLTKLDFVDFERHQRCFLNELAMKRGQVEDLKNELNIANLKIHEQTRSIESAKNTIDEQQHNLSLALKNTRFLEDTLQSKRDYVSRTQLQQESAVAEKETLRELLQKTELQNYNLTRELNELKTQHNCDVAYQKDFVHENSNIQEKISQLTDELQSYIIDKKKYHEMINNVGICEELQKSVQFYREELHNYKKKYTIVEEKLIESKATVENFEKLSKEYPLSFQISGGSQIIIDQWKRATERLTEQSKNQQALITNLTEKLKCESENTVKLCLREVELKEEMSKLKQEISILAKNKALENPVNTENDASVIKEDFIEISGS